MKWFGLGVAMFGVVLVWLGTDSPVVSAWAFFALGALIFLGADE